MTRRILVKVCGMSERENTLTIARLAPDYLGFIFVPDSPRYVEPSARAELLGCIPATTRTVAVFRDAQLEEVVESVKQYNLAAVQLHGAEGSDYIAELKRRIPSCYVFKALSLVEGANVIGDLPHGADLFIFDGARPGSGEGFDWELLTEYRGETPFLLAGGIGPQSLDRVRQYVQRYRQCLGIDVNSKVELRAGIKDEMAVRQVIEGVRV
jgi:phosphoribosylanthranilate isomerase